ncbi:hypothetical protein ACVXG7_17485 [Enterobacter hormaechei]
MENLPALTLAEETPERQEGQALRSTGDGRAGLLNSRRRGI